LETALWNVRAMKIARAAALAVAVLLGSAEAAQAWVPPHLIARPTELVPHVQPIIHETPVILRTEPSLEGDGAFGAPNEAVGEQLVTLRESEMEALGTDAHELAAGTHELEEILRSCIKGMLDDVNQDTMEGAARATQQQDSLLVAMATSIEACLKGQLEGPAGQVVGVATGLAQQQQQQAIGETSAYLAVQARNGITAASKFDADPAVLARWAHGDSGVAATAADEPVTTDPIAVTTTEDPGGPSKGLLILGASVVLFVALFGWRKLLR
jgi:hypothetical protein